VSKQEDIVLFKQIKQQNKIAFDILFRKYYQSLCRFALTFTHSEDLAEEVVQDMFVHFWSCNDNIQITISVKAYLYSSTRNHALNLIKKEKTRNNYEIDYATQFEHVVAPENSGEGIKALGIAIQNSIRKLPEKCREIFVLSRFEGLSYDEIAEYLTLSKKTVENQMGIAFKKLRELLLPQRELFYD